MTLFPQSWIAFVFVLGFFLFSFFDTDRNRDGCKVKFKQDKNNALRGGYSNFLLLEIDVVSGSCDKLSGKTVSIHNLF